jgi:hypothetical protein
MDHWSMQPFVLHLFIALLSAVNLVLNTWLVNRRKHADIREHKRNGHHSAHVLSDGPNVNQSEDGPSNVACPPKE